MSLVTPENIGRPGKGGWKITAAGRIVRSMKMRPERVLVLAKDLEETGKGRKIGKAVNGKVKKRRQKPALVRARRKSIDMIQWGSVHLKGAFLDVETGVRNVAHDVMGMESIAEQGQDGRTIVEDDEVSRTRSLSPSPSLAVPSASPVPTDTHMSLEVEKSKSLNLLRSLFGNEGDGEWGGKESVSELDIDEETRREDDGSLPPKETEAKVDMDGNEVEYIDHIPAEPEPNPQPPSKTNTMTTTKKLKDLFAVREDEGSRFFCYPFVLISVTLC